MLKVKVSKDAGEELTEAAAWYEQKQPGLGVRLISEFERVVSILRSPNAPLVPMRGNAGKLGAKRLILRKFPFSVVVADLGEMRIIVALAHHARKPGYWRERFKP